MFQRCGVQLPFAVDVVAGDAERRNVGQQVVQQDLGREHRQERQEQGGRGHADHVAEVGAGGDVDVLQRVGEGVPALVDALADHVEVVLEQHHVGRVPGHVDRGIDRDAHVGRVQCRCVVDAVAQVADHAPALLQRADDALLLVGLDLREHRGVAGKQGQRLVLHRGDLGAADHARRVQAHGARHVRGHQVVVAGDHLHADPELAERFQRFADLRLRRVEEQQEAAEQHRGLVGGAVARRRRQPLFRDAEDAEAVLAPGREERVEAFARCRVQFVLGAVEQCAVAAVEDLAQRALGDHARRAFRAVAHHDAEPLAAEVVGDLVALEHAARIQARRLAGGHDRLVERIREPGLQARVQPRELQHARIGIPVAAGWKRPPGSVSAWCVARPRRSAFTWVGIHADLCLPERCCRHEWRPTDVRMKADLVRFAIARQSGGRAAASAMIASGDPPLPTRKVNSSPRRAMLAPLPALPGTNNDEHPDRHPARRCAN